MAAPTAATLGGTTSACAENTPPHAPMCHPKGNYLRVRGEYLVTSWRLMVDRELPPRARRILTQVLYIPTAEGTTSACAENTLNELGLL